METGTQILIERMKTHPEEFVNGMHSKWARVMNMTECLPEEDKAAMKVAYDQAKIDYFNGEVLATLAGERDPLVSQETIKYKASERYGVGVTDPRTFGQAQIKAEGQHVFNTAQNSLTVGANGTSALGIGDWLTGGSK